MAKKGNTELGKAFEFACLSAIERKYSKNFNGNQDVSIIGNAPLITAKEYYDKASADDRSDLVLAADAAVKVLERLEPRLLFSDDTSLALSIQADKRGEEGDVRDVLCIRSEQKWEIGLSCKHNHHAVKHSRLSGTIDFGKEWTGHGCSDQYFEEIRPKFEELAKIRTDSNNTATWNDIEGKAENYYVPILKSFMEELRRLNEAYDDVPEKMVRYLLGKEDFYKITTDDAHMITRVEAININGTLGKTSKTAKPMAKLTVLKLPKTFYHIDFKDDSDNTVIVVCDEGWTFSFRIHSASSRVEPSLKFDITLISLPSTVYSEVQPWNSDKYYSE